MRFRRRGGVQEAGLGLAGRGVDGGGVAVGVVAQRLGADVEGGLDAVPGVVAGAAHLGQVPAGAQPLGPQRRVGPEAAAAQDHGLAVDLLVALVGLHPHPVHPACVVGQETGQGGLEEDLDPLALEDLVPHLHQAGAAVPGMDEPLAVVPLEAPPHAVVGVEDLPGDPRFLHPLHRGVGLVDQELGQLGDRPAVGYAHHVVVEVVPGVGHQVHALELAGRHLGHEHALLRQAVVGVAKLSAGAEPGVAAFLGLRGLLQHQDLRAVLVGREGRRFSGVPQASDDDISRSPGHDSTSR